MASIAEFLKSGSNVQIVVSAADLKEFALSIIDEFKKSSEVKQQDEKYLDRYEAAKMFGISTNTLWRWQQMGYLVPNKVGHRNYYPLSKLKALMEGKNNLNQKEG